MSESRKTASPRRWRQWSESEARKALAAWKRSGQSADAYARATGVSAKRLRYWTQRLADAAPVRFVPVGPLPSPAGVLEVTVRGVVLRVREDLTAEQLARVVAALAAALPPC